MGEYGASCDPFRGNCNQPENWAMFLSTISKLSTLFAEILDWILLKQIVWENPKMALTF